ncbi:MAG TPA: alpha/beta fold hydrolase [Stellaceae bacterium]|nr:alpha/beta fold hydrolase [Stellaceae bacterium]
MQTPIALACQEHGSGPPVLILHGLFGSAQNWTTVARRWAARFHVFALDLRNHGASPWADSMSYPEMAQDVAGFIAARGLGSAAIVGHSMGGKVAMALALAATEIVERLVVVDIAPVAHAPAHQDEIAAMQALDLARIDRRGAADAALKPSIPDDAVRAFLVQNLVAGPAGLRWRINLDVIAAEIAALSGFPDFPAGTAYPGPTLAVRGGRSPYVRDRDLAAFARIFPALRLVTIADAGHWLHAERMDEFLAAVTPFLDGAGDVSGGPGSHL